MRLEIQPMEQPKGWIFLKRGLDWSPCQNGWLHENAARQSHVEEPARMSEQRLKSARTFVMLGYSDILDVGSEFRSLEFFTDLMPTNEIRELVGMIKSYNAFQGERVAQAIERFGGRVEGWRFGRAGSPALEVKLPYWTHQIEGVSPQTEGVRISDADHESLLQELFKLAHTLGADVCETTDESRHTVRIWWD